MSNRLKLTATVDLIGDPIPVITKTTVRPIVRIDHHADIARRGRLAWEKIHTEPTVERLAEMERELKQFFGCSCDTFYADYKAKHPFPKDGTEWEKFVWTVDLHNSVNRKLKKPEMSAVDAWKKWRVNRCDQCGLCCRDYVITPITEYDLCREPRLSELLPIIQQNQKGCPLQLESGACGVYETRPDVCRRYVAGGHWCNLIRSLNGLEPI